jgi:hypothetical protein
MLTVTIIFTRNTYQSSGVRTATETATATATATETAATKTIEGLAVSKPCRPTRR